MFTQHTLPSLACDLLFFWGWFLAYQRVVPNGGIRRIAGIAGIAGMLSAIAGYLQLSASMFARWDAANQFDAWAMPLDVFEKLGVLAALVAVALIVLANRGTGRRPAAAN